MKRKRNAGCNAHSQCSSPFFKKKSASVRTPSPSITRGTSSTHFLTSPSSSFGSVHSFPHFALSREYFRNCPHFQRFYRFKTETNHQMKIKIKKNNENYFFNNISPQDPLLLTIIDCARHLCDHGCYLWAFAPIREWHSLRKAIVELSQDESPDVLLTGWKCKLSKTKSPHFHTTSNVSLGVVFCSPIDEQFESKAGVLHSLDLIKQKNEIVNRTEVELIMSQRANRKANNTGSFPPKARRLSITECRKTSNINTISSIASPFGLLEELFDHDPWKLLLSTILLSRTTRRQVDNVLFKFLQIWPTAEQVTAANVEEISDLIAPLGIQHRRARGIVQFSQDYLLCLQTKKSAAPYTASNTCRLVPPEAFDLSKEDILSFHQCGEYCYHAYRIFNQRMLDVVPTDHALQDYVEYQKAVLLKQRRIS